MSERPPARLVGAGELTRLLAAGAVTLLDCRYSLAEPDQGARAHRAGHPPGAVFADLGRDLSDPGRGGLGRHPLPDPARFARFLRASGVRRDRPVVVYDHAGGQFAARAWWLLRHVGHPDVALLDGGLAAWVAGGGVLVSGVPAPAPGEAAWAWGCMPTIDSDALAAALAAAEVRLVDARARERFVGASEPLDPIAGHIPGAVSRPVTESLRNGRFRAPAELRVGWEQVLAGYPPDRVVHSCGSGVTACHNLFSLTLAGLAGSRLYAPSWSGWIADPARPVAVGDV